MVKGSNDIAAAYRLDRNPIHRRARRKALIYNDQPGLGQLLQARDDRLDGRDLDLRIGQAVAAHDDPVRDALVVERAGDLIDEKPAVDKDHHALAFLRGAASDVGEEGGLSGSGGGCIEHPLDAAAKGGADVVDAALLVIAKADHQASSRVTIVSPDSARVMAV